jgi:hypothetical protein
MKVEGFSAAPGNAGAREPLANPGVRFDGKVVYKTGYSIITADEVDAVFIKRVADLMKEICGEAEPHKAPSFTECQHCPIPAEDCAHRAEAVRVYEGETNEF